MAQVNYRIDDTKEQCIDIVSNPEVCINEFVDNWIGDDTYYGERNVLVKHTGNVYAASIAAVI